MTATQGLAIAVCEGGNGPHALGIHGSRGPDWAATVRQAGATPVVLAARPLGEALARQCSTAGIRVLSPEGSAAPDAGALEPPQTAFPTPHQWTSVRIAQGLKQLHADGEPVLQVEFPDRGGWAFGLLQSRLLDGILESTTVCVRIEGTYSLRASYRPESQSLADLLLFDLERKAMADCDIIVADHAPVAESARLFHGFTPEQWSSRLQLGSTGVAVDTAHLPSPPALDSAIVCRVDHLSTACLASLARALTGFARTNPAWSGPLLFTGDTHAVNALLGRLPPLIRGRVEVLPNPETASRHGAAWFWLDLDPWSHAPACAVQASSHGAICIVHDGNPAYDTSTWREGVTCLRHDGTSAGVVDALSRGIAAGVPSRLVQTAIPCRPPGLDRPAPAVPSAEAARVSVVVPHYNLGAYLCETIENVRRFTPPGTEILVIDDASDDPASRAMVDAWQASPPPGVRVIALPFNVGLGAARNAGIAEAMGDYVVPVDADDLLAPGFVVRAVRALQRHAGFDFVVTQAAYFERSPASGQLPEATGFITFVGEARAGGLHANRFSTATCVMRRSVALQLRYREDLEAYEDWDLYRRAVSEGHRFIVDASVGFFYRHRSDSMVHAPAARAAHASHLHRMLAGHRLVMDGVDLPAQALECSVLLPIGRDAHGLVDVATLRESLEELERHRRSRLRRALLLARRVLRLPGFPRRHR